MQRPARQWLVVLGIIGAIFIIIMMNLLGHYLSQLNARPERIAVREKSWFLVGYNYPWYHYGHDFSASSDNILENQNEINAQFADMAHHDTHVTRWFMLNDFVQNRLFDDQGHIATLPSDFFRNLDAVLSIARNHQIYLTLDFIDGPAMLKKDNKDARQDSKIFMDPELRQEFFQRIVNPILQRYGQDPIILAWSPVNEPDYETFDISESEGHVNIPYDTMRAFLQQFTLAVHTYTHQMATIENGPLHFTHYWTNLGFDFYSPHYYDWMSTLWPDSNPVTNNAQNYQLDKPIVLGELPTGSSRYFVTEFLTGLYNNGHAGAIFWSFNAGDSSSDYENTKEELAAWEHNHQADAS